MENIYTGGMHLIVYIDYLILENFIINYFLLLITSQTIRQKLNNKRCILASLAASFYVFTIIIKKLRIFAMFPFKFAIAFGIIFLCYKFNSILSYLKTFLIYILYSVLLAGFCLLIQCCSIKDINISLNISHYSGNKLLIAAILLYISVNRTVVYIKDRKNVTDLIYTIDVTVNGADRQVKGFLDTGNELKEPSTGLPAIIAEKSIFTDIDLKKYDKYYIPCRTVTAGRSMLIGFRPDKITVNMMSSIKNVQAVICLCDKKLSEHNDYHALLCREIILDNYGGKI